MAQPEYRIYYGKYRDELNSEIPNSDIVSCGDLSFKIEPGKPAEPTIDGLSFTLKNLDHNGNELYGDDWVENNRRTQAEGANRTNEIIFRVELTTLNKSIVGVVSKIEYGNWRETVTISIDSLLGIVSKYPVPMLKKIKLENCELVGRFNHDGTDLDGNPINFQSLRFMIWDVPFDPEPLSDYGIPDLEVLNHFFSDGGDLASPNPGAENFESTGEINSFVKIEDNTFLTTINVFKTKSRDSDGRYNNYVDMFVYHIDNDIEGNVLERGKYFAGDSGEELQVNERYNIELLEVDRGYTENVVLDDDDLPFRKFFGGVPVIDQGEGTENGIPIEDFVIQDEEYADDPYFNPGISNDGDVLNIFGNTLHWLNDKIYSRFYNNFSGQDIFDISKTPNNKQYVFWGDLKMFGWEENKLGDIFVNLGMQMNCYVYGKEDSSIAFHHRLYHEDYLPDSLPPNSFEVDIGDINPRGHAYNQESFETYEIAFGDVIEINNVVSDDEFEAVINDEGITNNAALNSSSLEVNTYRTFDLGVPHYGETTVMPKLRRSPLNPNFALSLDLDDFIPTAVEQATNFAKSWIYPETIWKISWDMDKYPNTAIGAYFWVTHRGKNRVYFIREITYNVDGYTYKITAQEVGEYNGS